MRRFPAVSVLAILALLLAACGASNGSNASGLKVAFLLPGSVSDQGYNADGQRAADELKKQMGADVTVTENVSVPNQADVYRQYAAQKYDLVIGWGGQFTDGAVSVAQEFPDVKFLVVNSNAKNGNNLASLDTDIEDWEFLGGFVTAKLSKSGTIGWIGGQCFPATAANLHGVEQGAKYANPRIKVISTFTGDFEDPTKAQQAAKAMIDDGADALTGNLNNGWFGVFKAAKASGDVPVVTEWVDNSNLAPEVIASSILKSQARFVVEMAKKVEDGSFEGKFFQFGLPPDWGRVMSKTNRLSPDVDAEAVAVEKKIAAGEITPKHDTTCPNQ